MDTLLDQENEKVLILGSDTMDHLIHYLFVNEVIVLDGGHVVGSNSKNITIIPIHNMEQLSQIVRKLTLRTPIPKIVISELDRIQSITGSKRIRGSILKAIFDRITPRHLQGISLYATAEEHEMIFDRIFDRIIRV